MNLMRMTTNCCLQILPRISDHDFVEGDADLNSLLAYLQERVSCFSHTQQLCIKDCLQDSEFLKSYIGRQLAKVANIVNSIRKSVNAATYLRERETKFLFGITIARHINK